MLLPLWFPRPTLDIALQFKRDNPAASDMRWRGSAAAILLQLLAKTDAHLCLI